MPKEHPIDGCQEDNLTVERGIVAELYRVFRDALMDMQPDDTVLGVRRVLLLPGAAGVLMGIVWRRQFKIMEAMTAGAAGVCCVLWVAPAIIEWISAKEGMAGLISFGSGLTGMYVVDFVIKAAGDPWATLARWRGKDTP